MRCFIPSIIFRKKAVEKIKFNKKYYPAEDLDFLIKIGKNFNYGNLSYYLIKYKQRIDSLTNSKMSLMEKASLKIRFKLFFNEKFKKIYKYCPIHFIFDGLLLYLKK